MMLEDGMGPCGDNSALLTEAECDCILQATMIEQYGEYAQCQFFKEHNSSAVQDYQRCESGDVEFEVKFSGDYNAIVGDRRQEFLDSCTARFHGLRCVDVHAGSIIITLKGQLDEISDALDIIP
eukprot:UN05964